MDPVHFHLFFNHVPAVGTIVAVLTLAWGVARRSRDVTRVALAWLIVFAAATVPLYLSGEEAEERLEDQVWLDKDRVHEHEERAEAALVVVCVTGALAALALALSRKGRNVPLAASGVVLAAGLVSVALLVWTAQAGGLVHHEELRSPSTSR